jgi:hypothetical protein
MNTNDINQLSHDRDTHIRDMEHLKALAICHYVLGGITACYSTMFLMHVAFGLAMLLRPDIFGAHGNGPPPFFGWIFTVVGTVAVLSGWTTGILLVYSGRMLQQHRRRLFSQIVAGISCMCMPLGTVLGIFTLMILARPSVKTIYEPVALGGAQPLASGTVDPDEGMWLELEKRASQPDESTGA